MIRVALFASGTGTNAIKLLEAARNLSNVEIPLVVVDQPDASLLNEMKSRSFGAECVLIPKHGTREQHETEILHRLNQNEIQWVFLAGYMRILGKTLLQGLKGSSGRTQIINIHPSLLPKYPGLDAYRRAFEAKDVESGVTVHWVEEGVDTGPIIAQRSFVREAADTLHAFVERGKSVEWKVYPEVLKALNDLGTLDGVKL